MIEFLSPFLEHFCHLFLQIAQMGLILPRWGLVLPRSPPPTPVLYPAITHPSWGYLRTQITPSPPQNTPFPGLTLKVGKMNHRLGNLDPNWAKCLKSGQNVSRPGQKKFIHSVTDLNKFESAYFGEEFSTWAWIFCSWGELSNKRKSCWPQSVWLISIFCLAVSYHRAAERLFLVLTTSKEHCPWTLCASYPVLLIHLAFEDSIILPGHVLIIDFNCKWCRFASSINQSSSRQIGGRSTSEPEGNKSSVPRNCESPRW